MKTSKNFASRWGFILASVGSAVGMANVWGFPNKLGSNGGGAFLLIYLLFIFIFSYVGLPAEFAVGRRAATGTLGAYEKAWATRGERMGKTGGLLAWLPLAGSLCIALGYAVIVTYILKALVDSLVGTLMSIDAGAWFGAFSSTPYAVIPYHVIVVVGTLLTLYLGARSIEKTNKIMMPLFFVIFLILAVRVAMLPGVSEGYRFMFTPRWEALKDPMIWIWAMGQAVFSLSVTGSGRIVYGAYRQKMRTWSAWRSTRRFLTPSPPWSRRSSSSRRASPTGWMSVRDRACCLSRCRPSCRISRWGVCLPSSSTLR